MAEKSAPPPPPPKKGGAPPPPPKKQAPPPPGPPPANRKAPPPPKKGGAPRPPNPKRPAPEGKKSVPIGRQKPPAKRGPPPKGKPKSRPDPKKKRRRLRIKLGLRESEISDDDNRYQDEVGWTSAGTVLDDLEDTRPKEPEIITHQCSMCGSILQIPKPKRDRYKVQCAYPECGHADMIGV